MCLPSLTFNKWMSVSWPGIPTAWKEHLSPWWFLPSKGEYSSSDSKESLGLKELRISGTYSRLCRLCSRSFYLLQLFSTLCIPRGKSVRAGPWCSSSTAMKMSSASGPHMRCLPWALRCESSVSVLPQFVPVFLQRCNFCSSVTDWKNQDLEICDHDARKKWKIF